MRTFEQPVLAAFSRREAFTVARQLGVRRPDAPVSGDFRSEKCGRTMHFDSPRVLTVFRSLEACDDVSDFSPVITRLGAHATEGGAGPLINVRWVSGDAWFVWLPVITVDSAQEAGRNFERLSLLAIGRGARLVVVTDCHLHQIPTAEDLARVRDVRRRQRLGMRDRSVSTADDLFAEDISTQVRRTLSLAANREFPFAVAV